MSRKHASQRRGGGGGRRPEKDAPEVEGVATRFARGGDAWVETPSGRVVVAGAVPGDRVRVAPVGTGGEPRARLLEVVAPSPDRVAPECPVAERCGGCPFMIATPALERAFKVARVEATVRDARASEDVAVAWHAAPEARGYRRRVRLSFAGGATPRLGYRERRSHRLLDVPGCPVLEAPLEEALATLRSSVLPALAGEGEIRLALGDARRPVASVHTERAQPPSAYAALDAVVASGALAGAALHAGEGAAPAVFGDPSEVTTGDDGLPMRSAVAGFTQANDAVNRALVREAIALAEPEGASVLELFAGAGNLTVPLARRAGRVVAVEIAEAAVASARANLAARGLDAKLVCAPAEQAPRGRFDVVVLDPPRAGAGDAVARVIEARPSRIVYVSCEPSTLGKDVRALAAAGYRVDRAHAFDMFPRTAHVESLVRLVAT